MNCLVFFRKAGMYTCLFLLVLQSFLCKANTEDYYLSAQQSIAFKEVLSFRFDNVSKYCNANTAYNFQMKSLAYCLQTFMQCDKQLYLKGKRLEIKWHDSIADLPEDETKRFVKAQVKLHGAFLANAFGEQFSAGLNVRQAYLLLKENYKYYPNHKPTLLYLGLLNLFMAEIPPQYQFLASLVGIEGDKAIGEKLIAASNSNCWELNYEKYMWLLIRTSNETLIEESDDVHKIPSAYLKYPLSRFLLAFHSVKTKNAHQAQALLKIDNHNFPLLSYLKGVSSFYAISQDSSLLFFNKFLRTTKAPYFQKDALLKLATIMYLKGQNEQSKKNLIMVRHKGNEVFYVDRLAQVGSRNQFPPEEILLARILFDGGNWKEAKIYLKQWDISSITAKTEYYYRLGRILLQEKQAKESIENFQQCIKICPKDLYYGPYACLYLSEIYIAEKVPNLALNAINQSSRYSNFEFEYSFNRKKALLKQRLGI